MSVIKLGRETELTPYIISAFYKFCKITDLHLVRDSILSFCEKNDVLGTILLGEEGVNGTISGIRNNVEEFYAQMEKFEFFSDILFKESFYKKHPFGKIKVKIRDEIVSIHEKCTFDPGTYIKPCDWDSFIKQEDVILVDTRNDFEYCIGTFHGAINPETTSFYEFKDWCFKNIPDKAKKIAGFCTGGIRCEKSTSWLKKQGYENVYHLDGGIIGYFIETQNKNNLWHGDCFVFDDRVAIDDHLNAL